MRELVATRRGWRLISLSSPEADDLGSPDADTSHAVEEITQNRAVISVPDFATAAEVCSLRGEGERAAAAQMQNPLSSSATRLRLDIFGRELSDGSVVEPLRGAQALAEMLVHRAISLVQTELPLLADALRLTGCTADTELDYSDGEPAINVYYGPGGDFKPHRDARALTLLLPLCTASIDYEGGGTAFYAPDAEPGPAIRGKLTPVIVLRPPSGTALLWGGTLLHAGAEVTAGQRLIFVASFTPSGSATASTTGSAPETGEEGR